MATGSEYVLLQMGDVRYNHANGTLFMMNERITWMMENRAEMAVSHKYQDIKMQKISPEGKEKVLLQVVLYDGHSAKFHFVNQNGISARIADRDTVSKLLRKLLPNYMRKCELKLEERDRILSENPHLLQLWKDLVTTGVISCEEFWSNHAKQYTQQMSQKLEEDLIATMDSMDLQQP